MARGRRRRAGTQLRELIAEALLRDLADPRLRSVTITEVQPTPDLREATVLYVTRSPEERPAAQQGLESARGVLQGRIGRALDTRHTPVLRFVYDDHTESAEALTRLIDELAADEPRGRQ